MAQPEKCLQETYAPDNACFGCGPANPKGLRIRSFADGDAVVATWRPEKHHEAFPGILNGGIVGALLDCHSNWAATTALMRAGGAPTPSDGELRLWAKAVEVKGSRAVVEATLSAGGKTCATCRGTFVAVKPGHPAYHRW